MRITVNYHSTKCVMCAENWDPKVHRTAVKGCTIISVREMGKNSFHLYAHRILRQYNVSSIDLLYNIYNIL